MFFGLEPVPLVSLHPFCLGFFVSSFLLDSSAMPSGLESNGFMKKASCGVQSSKLFAHLCLVFVCGGSAVAVGRLWVGPSFCLSASSGLSPGRRQFTSAGCL